MSRAYPAYALLAKLLVVVTDGIMRSAGETAGGSD